MWLGRVVRAVLRGIGKNTSCFAVHRSLGSVSDAKAPLFPVANVPWLAKRMQQNLLFSVGPNAPLCLS